MIIMKEQQNNNFWALAKNALVHVQYFAKETKYSQVVDNSQLCILKERNKMSLLFFKPDSPVFEKR